MKKFIFFVMITFFAITTLWSQTNGQLVLQGTVPLILQLTISPAADISALDLTTTFSGPIAMVTEKTNKRTGYNITISSTSAQALESNPVFKGLDIGNTETLSYSLTYDGEPVNFISGVATIIGPNIKTSSAGSQKQVILSYDGTTQFLNADTYKDTLTFTIIAK